MPSKKERQQIIVLCVILGIIAALLVWNFRRSFLPRPVGSPIVLGVPPRLQLPATSAADHALYQRSDFQAIAEDRWQPLRPGEINGNGSPFDDILPQ